MNHLLLHAHLGRGYHIFNEAITVGVIVKRREVIVRVSMGWGVRMALLGYVQVGAY